MSNIENLQTEFEKLIAELEKLKSVNEFASANTESAQHVIETMSGFVERIVKFEEELKKHQGIQYKSITKLITEFTEAVRSFEESRNNLKTSVTTTLSEKLDEQKTQLDALSTKLTEFNEELKLSSESWNSRIDKFHSEFTEAVKSFNDIQKNLEKTITTTVSVKLDDLKTQVDGLGTLTDLKNELRLSREAIKTDLLKFHEDTTTKVLTDQKERSTEIQKELSGFSKQTFMLLAIIAVTSSLAAICTVLLLVYRE